MGHRKNTCEAVKTKSFTRQNYLPKKTRSTEKMGVSIPFLKIQTSSLIIKFFNKLNDSRRTAY